MRTGFDLSAQEDIGNNQVKAAVDLITPVIENSVILASKYAHACGRDTLLEEDMVYAMKFCVMHTVGQNIGSIFPEIYDEEESDEEDLDIVSEDECPTFKKYSGDDPLMNRVNEAYDNWENWTPMSPIQEFLKSAIDNNGGRL